MYKSADLRLGCSPAERDLAGLVDGCTGFAWEGFGSKIATEVACVRNWLKLPLCPREPVPVGSKMDPPVLKAEPISDSGFCNNLLKRRRKNPV